LTPLLRKTRGRSFIASRIALVLGSGIISLALTGCPSLSTMQTPRTVPQGQVRFGLGFEAVGIKTAARTDSSTGTTTPSESVTFPQFELTLRYGVTDNLDIGGKLYLIGAEAGFKYQFLRGPLDVAIAPAASYISIGSSSGDTSSSVSATYLHLPVLFGFNLNDNVAISFGPKFLYTIASISANDTSSRSSAATSGLWLGGYLPAAQGRPRVLARARDQRLPPPQGGCVRVPGRPGVAVRRRRPCAGGDSAARVGSAAPRLRAAAARLSAAAARLSAAAAPTAFALKPFDVSQPS
jgi:hypothetical protein